MRPGDSISPKTDRNNRAQAGFESRFLTSSPVLLLCYLSCLTQKKLPFFLSTSLKMTELSALTFMINKNCWPWDLHGRLALISLLSIMIINRTVIFQVILDICPLHLLGNVPEWIFFFNTKFC